MRNNLLKMFFICLLLGSFFAAEAQPYPRKGWPAQFVRAKIDFVETTGWALNGDIALGVNPNFPNRIAGYSERVNNGGIMDPAFVYLNVFTGGSTVPDSMVRAKYIGNDQYQIDRIYVFTYDPNVTGRKIATIEKTPANGFVEFERVVDSFDASGKVVYSEIQRRTSIWYKIKEVNYYYNGSGKMDSTVTKEDNGDSLFVPTARTQFTYSADGTLAEEKLQENMDGTWTDISRYRFEYTNGIEEVVLANKLNVYPNPCQDMINVVLPEDARNINAEVYNMIGQKVYSVGQNAELSKGILKIDISSLPAGSYILRCSNNNQVYTQIINKN
jgi:hypothetical protein